MKESLIFVLTKFQDDPVFTAGENEFKTLPGGLGPNWASDRCNAAGHRYPTPSDNAMCCSMKTRVTRWRHFARFRHRSAESVENTWQDCCRELPEDIYLISNELEKTSYRLRRKILLGHGSFEALNLAKTEPWTRKRKPSRLRRNQTFNCYNFLSLQLFYCEQPVGCLL